MGILQRILPALVLSASLTAAAAPPTAARPADAKRAQKPAAPAKPAADVPELNKKVLAYCAERAGQQVADGECANLVNEAYKAVGAMRRRAVPKPAGVELRDDDYVWGRLLGPNDPVLPGDIIQLRDVKIVKKTGNGRTPARWPTTRPS